MDSSAPWWRHASVYQIYVRSFADANGDGIGDLAGITSRLEYIKSLGVDAIWLNPCFPSPQRDHGYDVADYFDIEPDYGSMVEFDEMVATARALGIRVILDVVPNHCSNEHPWFTAAVAAGPGSPERERFWFRAGRGVGGSQPPNNWKAIFGGSAWTRVTEPDGSPGEWYLGVFTSYQPDWNFNHPEVVKHFEDMLQFWFDRGVDGFRADAVIYLGKVEGLPDASEADVDSPLNPMYTYVEWQHHVWRQWRDLVNNYEAKHGRQLLLVAEAFSPNDPKLMVAYANPQEFHQAFAFDLMLAAWDTDRIREVIHSTLAASLPHGLLPAWTLNNHDTQRTPTRYGRSDAVQMGGFHDGVFRISQAPVDDALGQRRARAAAGLALALPGCVYLYAGEELGLPEVLDLPDDARQDPVFHNSNGESLGRDGCRVPLPWEREPSRSHGFSVPENALTSWLPQPAGWGSLSVGAQAGDSASALEFFRKAGSARGALEGMRTDHFEWVDGLNPTVVGFARGNTLVVFNPTGSAVGLDPAVVGDRHVQLASVAGHVDQLVVPADATMWLA